MATNPMANGGNFLSKITNGKKKKNNDITTTGIIIANLVGMNNSVEIVSEACSCCWDKPLPNTYEELAGYIARRGKTGHTSIIEHSNYVILLEIDMNYEDSLVSFLDNVHYLYTKTIFDFENRKIYLLIGGSYRGFSDIYRETDDMSNPVLQAVTGNLYTYAPSCMFEDIINLGILNKSSFLDSEPDENFCLIGKQNAYECDKFRIVSYDDMDKLYKNISSVSKYVAERITKYDLCKFTTVTILFKNMSRVITQQLCRHRNAITQESQRYVDYSKACFNDPCMFKPGRYDPDHKYTVQFGSSSSMFMTLKQIGESIVKLYGMLHNPVITGKEYALMQEDARAFLPGNTQCRKIYMTFTYKSLIKFLYLREDKAAQAEIRMYATEIGDWFRDNTLFINKEICDMYTNPRLLIKDENPITIDEVSEVDVNEEITEDDYIKAMGIMEEINNPTAKLEKDDEV